MKRLALCLAFIFWASAALAQMSGVRVVATCGTPSPWPALQTNPLGLAATAWLTVDTNYNLCTTGGGGGGSVSGGWLFGHSATAISATTGGNSTTITGTDPEALATNVGTTNPAFCRIGGTATTSDQEISPNGGWFIFQTGAGTQLTCITAISTTTVNVQTGSGLATGTGGGGGSASGNVFQATAFNEGTASTAATTQVFALSGTTTIYLVNYAYQTDAGATGNGTFQIVTGTGTNCSTIHQTLTPVWNFAQNAGIAEGSIGVLGASTAGDELCVVTTASQTVNWRIGIVQQ